MLSCRDVASLATDYLDEALPLRRRIALRLHLAMCENCRRFMTNMRRLPTLVSALPVRAEHDAIAYKVADRVIRGRSGKLTTADYCIDNGKPPPAPKERPHLHLVQDSGGEPRVDAIFAEIESALGLVPNLFRAYANQAEVLEVNWNRVKAVMLRGSLSRALKECIAVLVSHDNGCRYCVVHHSRTLVSLGVSQEEVDRLLREPLAGNFAPKERALLALARQANTDPFGASAQAIALARHAGASDAEIIEALAVMELFLSFNRFLQVVDMPLEA